MRPNAIIFFRTQSPRHFEGGDWDEGGSCPRLHPLLSHEVNLNYTLVFIKRICNLVIQFDWILHCLNS